MPQVVLQEQTLALTRDRYRAGLVSELDTSRAEAQAANTRSRIPLLEQDIQRSIHRLSILLGKEPAQVEAHEVENALVACGKEQEHYQSLRQSEGANRRSVELADECYRGGLVDFLNVLEARRSLLAVQEELACSERTMGQNIVRLYKALGGGWEEETQLAAAETGVR